MKRIVLVLIVYVFIGSLALTAQRMGHRHGQDKIEIIEEEKVAFFNERLGLTDEEAKKFWPIYNDFQNRKVEIFSERKNKIKFLDENAENMSEGEINKYMEAINKSFKDEAVLIETYFEKFKEVLPLQKVVKIYQAEHKFKKYLFGKIKEKRGNGRPPVRED